MTEDTSADDMAMPKVMLTKFGIHYGLESWGGGLLYILQLENKDLLKKALNKKCIN